MIFGLWGLKADLPGRVPCHGRCSGCSRREVVVEGRLRSLMLRHQLAVGPPSESGRRARAPGLTWPDRAWLALLAGTVPTVGACPGCGYLVTPGTIFALGASRQSVRRRWGRLSAGRWPDPGGQPRHRKVRFGSAAARPGRERVLGIPADPPARPRGTGHQPLGAVPRSGRSSRTPGSTPAPPPPRRSRVGPSSCDHRHRGSWPWTSSPPTSSTAPRCTSFAVIETRYPPRSGSWAPRSIPPRRGSCSQARKPAHGPGGRRDAGSSS